MEIVKKRSEFHLQKMADNIFFGGDRPLDLVLHIRNQSEVGLRFYSVILSETQKVEDWFHIWMLMYDRDNYFYFILCIEARKMGSDGFDTAWEYNIRQELGYNSRYLFKDCPIFFLRITKGLRHNKEWRKSVYKWHKENPELSLQQEKLVESDSWYRITYENKNDKYDEIRGYFPSSSWVEADRFVKESFVIPNYIPHEPVWHGFFEPPANTPHIFELMKQYNGKML
jgi:hypothetical protein